VNHLMSCLDLLSKTWRLNQNRSFDPLLTCGSGRGMHSHLFNLVYTFLLILYHIEHQIDNSGLDYYGY